MENRSETAQRVAWATIAVNLILSAMKLAAGIFARSGAMVSDAVHSASDVFSTVIVLIGVKMSAKEADREHPYGHERMECVAAIVLAVTLFITGLFIGCEGVRKALFDRGELAVPGAAALIAAILSIAVKEAMFWHTRHYAKKLGSDALMADAWHHRSDALSSVGALVGIGGAMLGFPVLDPLAGVVIAVFIARAAYGIFREAIDKMVDHSCDAETEEAIRSLVLSHEGVDGIDLLRTREFGSRIYIELEISADGGLSFAEAHSLAHRVHDSVEAAFPQVKHIIVHINPKENTDD